MEKEINTEQQLVPTEDQYEKLRTGCRKDILDFDSLSPEQQDENIADRWLSEREQGVKKLANYFIVSHFYLNEGLDMEDNEEKTELKECVSILRNHRNNITQVFLEERLSSLNPLLVQDDYGRVIKDYWEFVKSINSLRS